MDDVEDIVRPDSVLVLVHQQEDPALQVNIEDDRAVQSGHLEECQQVLATPAKTSQNILASKVNCIFNTLDSCLPFFTFHLSRASCQMCYVRQICHILSNI